MIELFVARKRSFCDVVFYCVCGCVCTNASKCMLFLSSNTTGVIFLFFFCTISSVRWQITARKVYETFYKAKCPDICSCTAAPTTIEIASCYSTIRHHQFPAVCGHDRLRYCVWVDIFVSSSQFAKEGSKCGGYCARKMVQGHFLCIHNCCLCLQIIIQVVSRLLTSESVTSSFVKLTF